MQKVLAVKLILFCIICQLSSKEQSLYGFVMEQNSGKKPVEGVFIKSSFGANQVTTKNLGDYILTFQDARPGKSVRLSVEKDNWVITDQTKLETNLPEDPAHHPHIIVMCRKQQWEQQNKDYKTLLENYIRKTYEKERALLNKVDAQYQKKIDSLQDKFSSLEKGLNELADLYSKTNIDDLSEIEKKAWLLFKAGNIDECITLRKSLESEKNFLKAGEKEKQLDSLSKLIDTAKTASKNEKELHKRNLREEARLAQLKYDFKTAEEKLSFLALNDSTDYDNLFSYAYFLQIQNRLDKAISYYFKALNITSNKKNISLIQNNLGVIYMYNNNYAASEKSFNISLEISQSLSKDTIDLNQSFVALTLNNLGLLYFKEHNYTVSEKAQFEAIKIYKRLNKAFSGNFFLDLIRSLCNLGALLNKERKYYESEHVLVEALEITKRYDGEQNLEYDHIKAVVLQNLGNLYNLKNNYTAAEKAHLKSLDILRKLAKDNSAAYMSDLSGVLNDLGAYYVANNRYIEAKKLLEECLDITRNQLIDNPSAYEPDLATNLQLLGFLYTRISKYRDAEEAYLESIKIKRLLSKKNPPIYEPSLIKVLIALGELYNDDKNYNEAEKYYLESIEIMKRYSTDSIIARMLAANLTIVGILYNEKGDYPAAEKAYIEAIELNSKFLNATPDESELSYCNTVVNLGFLYTDLYYSDTINAYFKYSHIADSILSHYPDDNEIKKDKLQLSLRLQSPENAKIGSLRKQLDKQPGNKEKIVFQLQIIVLGKKIADRKGNRYAFALASDLGSLSWYLLLDQQFTEAEIAAKEALQPAYKNLKDNYYLAETEWINTNLALALLYQGKYAEAEKIYMTLKDKPYGKAFYRETFLADLDELEKAGITHRDVAKIRTLLK